MKKTYLLILSSILLSGCASFGVTSVTGPVSGKKYIVADGQVLKKESYQKELREHFYSKNPNVSQEIRSAIDNGYLILGMTKDQVRASWGDPQDISHVKMENYKAEAWFYESEHYGSLFFRGNELALIQD